MLDGWLGVRSDGRWAAPRVGLAVPRQNGKNGVAEMRELFGMVQLGERFLHTAHEVKTARKAFSRLLEFFDNERQFPELKRLVREVRRTNGQEAIYLTNGGSVEFIARSKGSGRGYSVDVLVLDEAQELSEDALAALLPTVSASPNPQQIAMGTPPGPTAVGEVFTRMRATGLEGNDHRLCWMEWGCHGKDVDLDSPQAWAQANPALGIRLRPETIADERALMDDETFARERLGMWGDALGGGVLDIDRWSALTDGQSNPEDPVAFAVDVSPDRSRSTIAIAGRRPDGLSHLEVVDAEEGTGWVASRLVELDAKWSPCAIVLDPGGPAGALLPDLERAQVDTVKVSGREYAQACGAFFDAVQQARFRHLGDVRLTTAVAAARKRPLGDAWAWHRRDSATDITPLVAVTLALHGLAVAGAVRPRSKAAFGF